MFGLFGNSPMTFAEENTPQPQGLLGGFFNDPRKMAGLAAFGQALAQAGAPSRTGNHWGLGLSQALGGAAQGMRGFDQQKIQDEMQQMQLTQMRAAMNQKAMPKTALDFISKIDPKDYTPESMQQFAASLDPTKLRPRSKVDFVDGRAVDPYNTTPGTVIPQRLAPDSVMTYDGAGNVVPNAQVIAAKKEIAAAGRPQTNVNLPPAERAFEVETAKLDAKQLDEFRDSAQKASGGLARIGEMKRLASEGVTSGSFAEGRVGVANFFSTLGANVDQKKLANSQEYLKHMKELTLSMLKESVGSTNISNADLKFVNDTVPQLETNPKARENLLNYMESRLQSSVDRFQRADEYARKNRGLGGFQYQAPKPQEVNNVKNFGAKNVVVDGKTFEVLETMPDGIRKIRDPKTGRTGTLRP